MKILFILENYYPSIGGVETLFKSLTEELAKNGNSVTILTNRNHNHLPYKQELNGTTIIRPKFINRYLFTLLAIFPAIFYSFRHDIIHTTSYNAGVPSIIAGIISRRRVIITFHEVWGGLWDSLPYLTGIQRFFFRTFERALLRLPFYRFIAVSKYTEHALVAVGVKEEKIKMIYNGLDYEVLKKYRAERTTTSRRTFAFIYYGRLGVSKGINLILKASEILFQEGKDMLVTLVIPKTPTKFFERIMDEINGSSFTNNYRILHHLPFDELMTEVATSDCVLIPSYSEGFGFTAAQAVAVESPIISSGLGSLTEVVGGRYLEMIDQSPEGLANAMRLAIQGRWEYIPVQSFSLKESVLNYTDLYQEVMSNG